MFLKCFSPCPGLLVCNLTHLSLEIPMMRFLLQRLISIRFFHSSEVVFSYLSVIPVCLMVSASNNPMYLEVSFSPSVLILSWFGYFIPSVIYCFPLFIMSMEHLSMLNSIPIFWLYILIVYFRVPCIKGFFFCSQAITIFFSLALLSLRMCWSMYS